MNFLLLKILYIFLLAQTETHQWINRTLLGEFPSIFCSLYKKSLVCWDKTLSCVINTWHIWTISNAFLFCWTFLKLDGHKIEMLNLYTYLPPPKQSTLGSFQWPHIEVAQESQNFRDQRPKPILPWKPKCEESSFCHQEVDATTIHISIENSSKQKKILADVANDVLWPDGTVQYIWPQESKW